jgi:hypothetical protein
MENSISIILPAVVLRATARPFVLRTPIAAPSERAGTFAAVRAPCARVRSDKIS